MKQLINDQLIRKCPMCQKEFVGNKILDHEQECQNRQNGCQNKVYKNQQALDGKIQEINQQMQQKYQFDINTQAQQLKKCEYCNEDYPIQDYNLHIEICKAKKQLFIVYKSEDPFQNQQNCIEYADESQTLEILTQYFKLIENNENIFKKGEELIKISNFSIRPFTKTFQIKICKSCKKNFKLDESILVMKCCSQLYHHICLAKILKQSINCECGKQFINE